MRSREAERQRQRERKQQLRELLGPGLHLWEPWQVVALGFGAGVFSVLFVGGSLALLKHFVGGP